MIKIDSHRWGELSPLLDQVLELAGEERVAWLQALQATRPDVAAELQAMLAELQSLDDEGFLEGDPSRMLSQPSLVGSGTTLQKLRRTLRGDLDNIVAKALKKNPQERYSSVREFAADLRRYLKNEPVIARADNSWYRIRKFVARNRFSVTVAAAALMAVLATAAVAMLS